MWDWTSMDNPLSDPRDWFGEWLTATWADWVMGELNPATDDTLENFDPRDSHTYRVRDGNRTYDGSDPNSWYVDLGNDGTIDAHVVRDGFGSFWVDLGDGYERQD